MGSSVRRVIGVDPSLTSTGLVSAEAGRVTAAQRVRSKAKGADRVQEILDAIELAIKKRPWRDEGELCLAEGELCLARPVPDDVVVGIEGPAMGAKGSSVVQIFGLWGIITHQLWQWGVPFYVVPPSSLKKYATGKGNASKDEVLARVVRNYPDVDVTGNDVADALVIAAIGARRHLEYPLESTITNAQLDAMGKVQWGEVAP